MVRVPVNRPITMTEARPSMTEPSAHASREMDWACTPAIRPVIPSALIQISDTQDRVRALLATDPRDEVLDRAELAVCLDIIRAARSVVDDMVHEELIGVPGRVSTYPRYDQLRTRPQENPELRAGVCLNPSRQAGHQVRTRTRVVALSLAASP